jgi:hypothetical protein
VKPHIAISESEGQTFYERYLRPILESDPVWPQISEELNTFAENAYTGGLKGYTREETLYRFKDSVEAKYAQLRTAAMFDFPPMVPSGE